MADMSQLLNSLAMMQPNAQAALPVIPNNGNPQGANNMPNNPMQPTLPNTNANALQHYPWLAPSPSMTAVQQMLQTPLIQPNQQGQFINTVHPIMAGGGPVMPQQPMGAISPIQAPYVGAQPVTPVGVPSPNPIMPRRMY